MTAFDFTELLGSTLHSKGNAEVATTTLGTNGKEYIALYFTASWCPPCRAFTPVLIDYYLQPHIQEKLDVVVVSSDREESAHDEYFAKMPWLSLPYVDRDRKKVLAETFEVKGIPTFVLISAATGQVITKELRFFVEKDPKGHFFPYPEKSIRTVLSKVVTTTTTTGHESFSGKTLALYFDGNPASSKSSQETKDALLSAYQETKETALAFEVLQISWEQTAANHATHAAQVPWPTVAFDEKFDTAFHLARLYNLSYNQPAIVILDPARNIINKDAAGAIRKGHKFPFSALKVVDLNESSISNNYSIWEKPAVIVYLESVAGDAEKVEAVERVVNAVAERIHEASVTGGAPVCTDESCDIGGGVAEPDVIFFTVKAKHEGARWYRQSAGLGDEVAPDAILYDFNKGRNAFPFRGELTEDNLVQFVQDFKTGKLLQLKEQEAKEEKL
ncbi:thioredoxin-like-domain-containing protein [Obelidium mucronatum]|nr:thioredoxin-like-domain-containing protein [Obelidium mucronatum]